MSNSSIIMNELGHFYVVSADGCVYAGPYDTPEDAVAAHPEVDCFDYCVDEDDAE